MKGPKWDLSREAASQVHGSGGGLGRLEPEHDGGGEFVMSCAAARLLLQRFRQTLWSQARLTHSKLILTWN